MAFVARRSSDGTVVDHQQVSGRRAVRPLTLSDISDEDSETVLGYTNRTYVAPTVRLLSQGDGETEIDDVVEPKPKTEDQAEEDSDVDNLFEDSLEDHADISDSETDSIRNFCNELEEEEANDALRSEMMNFTDEDSEDLAAEASKTQRSMGKEDEASATDTETVMNFDQDIRSLSSFDSCTPTVTLGTEDLDNLDNLSGKTFFKEDVLDDISSKTSSKQSNEDGLSRRTFTMKSATKEVSSNLGSDLESDQGQMSSRTYDLSYRGSNRGSNRGSIRGSERGSNRLHDGSSLSTCSWSEMYGGALQQSNGRSNIVPSLSLASATSETSTFYKSIENKERQGKAAFEDWIARKAAQKQKNLLAAKQEREKREAEAALRQKLSQERFQEWCRRKEQQQQKDQQQHLRKKTSTTSQSSSGNFSTSSSISGYGSSTGSGPSTGPVRLLPPEVTKKRILEWQRVKNEQQQTERERQRRLRDSKQKQEEDRKQRSQGAWKNWMKQVDKRAKPVPLNQGFDSLRGTISNIYINPVQWVSNIDPQESGRSR
ncbi:uncharacterized protein DDB_G0287625 [Drosophila eugracilis]|uniref:uncharacterized protein DDB_G0287625 n=1 Tax=Drosophila eugracilis TaxID=29029 RepID=UPI001BD9A04D|nr:uncharacterized protein DDB_G0287625 [Drosophila eugracilis]